MIHSNTSYHIIINENLVRVAFGVMILLVLSLLVWSPVKAQVPPEGVIEIEPGGKIWIDGTAGIIDFTCTAKRFLGNGSIKNMRNPQQNIRGHGDVSVAVAIAVRLLDCGKKKMNNDMYEALKAEQYKSINYRLIDAELMEEDSALNGEEMGWMHIKTTGMLKIAGVKDTTQMLIQGKVVSDDRFWVKGSKQISMKTYDIKPPTALFSLIKASPELTVHFDVIVRLKNDNAAEGISRSMIHNPGLN